MNSNALHAQRSGSRTSELFAGAYPHPPLFGNLVLSFSMTKACVNTLARQLFPQ
jgi:hypothetical protein